jgi:hypothetical protein
MVVTEVI